MFFVHAFRVLILSYFIHWIHWFFICAEGFDLDFRGFLEPKGFLSTFCDTRYNLVTTGEDLQDPLPSELAERYQDAKFITVGPLLQAWENQKTHTYTA